MIVDQNLPQKEIVEIEVEKRLGGDYNVESVVNDDGTQMLSIEYIGAYENRLAKFASGQLTAITAEDLEGATKLDNYFLYDNPSVISVETPSSLTTIGTGVGQYADKITTVDLSKSTKLTKIPSGCFGANPNITSVIFPDSITEVDSAAFNQGTFTLYDNAYYIPSPTNQYFCLMKLSSTSVTEFTVPDYCNIIRNSMFSGNKNIQSFTIGPNAKLKKLPANMFSNATALTTVNLGKITNIGEYAFSSCSGLTSIDIPDTVTTLEKAAFQKCTGLTKIVFPASITSISSEGYLLDGCTNLTELELNGNFNFPSSAGNNNFKNLTKVTKLLYNVKSASNTLSYNASVFSQIGSATDGCDLTIGPDVTRIPSYMFSTTSNSTTFPNIKTVKFAENSKCTTVYTNGFQTLKNLESIEFADSITTFSGTGCVSYCPKLTQIVFSDTSKLKTLSSTAFWNNTGLQYVELPSTLTSIGSQTFQGDTSLTKIRIKATTPPTLSAVGAFSKCPLETIEVPIASVDVYKAATNWSSFADKIVGYEEVTV